MKPFTLFIFSILCYALLPLNLRAQSQEVTQLVLNIEKLAQFKAILSQMKTGYLGLDKAYSRIQNIEQNTYLLHQNYLDALFQVSPQVRNYQGVKDCLTKQKHLAQTYQHLEERLNSSALLDEQERNYIQNYAEKILQHSLINMDDLMAVLRENVYRMSVAERLKAIDRSHSIVANQLSALSGIDGQLTQLLTYRAKQIMDKNQRNKFLSLR